MSETPKAVRDAIYAMESSLHEAYALSEAAQAVVAEDCEPNTVAFIHSELCDRVKELRELWTALHRVAVAQPE